MSNIQHNALTDPNLHEPKGASTAASGAVYVANGSGSGSWTKQVQRLTATLSPALVAANTTAEQSFTVSGVVLATDDCINVRKPTHQAGLGIVNARVTADNTINIVFSNNTGGGITPTASEAYAFFIWRS